jgi:hypothetical protein
MPFFASLIPAKVIDRRYLIVRVRRPVHYADQYANNGIARR